MAAPEIGKNARNTKELLNIIFRDLSPNKGRDRTTDKLREYFYLRLTQPQLNKKACVKLAGYTGSTTPAMVEKTKAFKSIRERIEQAAINQGIGPDTVFSTLKRSMDRSKLFIDGRCDTSANQAAKITGDFLGMSAPVEINHNVVMQQQALIGVLNAISPSDKVA